MLPCPGDAKHIVAQELFEDKHGADVFRLVSALTTFGPDRIQVARKLALPVPQGVNFYPCYFARSANTHCRAVLMMQIVLRHDSSFGLSSQTEATPKLSAFPSNFSGEILKSFVQFFLWTGYMAVIAAVK